MFKQYYAVTVKETDVSEERLVWYGYDSKGIERKYFYGGSAIIPCIFTAPQSARARIKRMRRDFLEGAQFHVRKVFVGIDFTSLTSTP